MRRLARLGRDRRRALLGVRDTFPCITPRPRLNFGQYEHFVLRAYYDTPESIASRWFQGPYDARADLMAARLAEFGVERCELEFGAPDNIYAWCIQAFGAGDRCAYAVGDGLEETYDQLRKQFVEGWAFDWSPHAAKGSLRATGLVSFNEGLRSLYREK